MAIGLPAKYQEKRLHSTTKELAKAKAMGALESMKLAKYLDNTNENGADVLGYQSIGSSAMSLGEKIMIYIGNSEILVSSECLNLAQFLDFGKNKKIVLAFFEAFNELSDEWAKDNIITYDDK